MTADSTEGTARRKVAPMCSDWHRVGAGLSVRFSTRGDRLDAEWRTRPPTKREWKRVMDRYRAGRDQFLAALAKRAELTVAVIEAAA